MHTNSDRCELSVLSLMPEIPVIASGSAATYFWCLPARDYKLHPCNLPFRSFYKRSILLQAKLVLRSSQ